MSVEYFLRVDGVAGDASNKAFAGWFAVDNFDFAVATSSSAGSGASAGKAEFSPLTVDIHSLTGLASPRTMAKLPGKDA